MSREGAVGLPHLGYQLRCNNSDEPTACRRGVPAGVYGKMDNKHSVEQVALYLYGFGRDRNPGAIKERLAQLHNSAFGWVMVCCGRDPNLAAEVLGRRIAGFSPMIPRLPEGRKRPPCELRAGDKCLSRLFNVATVPLVSHSLTPNGGL